SETALMSVNRYRLKNLARKKNRSAKRVEQLLERPDRLLGVILIGNTCANIFASAVATLLADRLFGAVGVWVGTIMLTLTVLIFAETAPKTFAAFHPLKVSLVVSWVLKWLLKLMYPLVWLINGVSNGFLYLFGVRVHHRHSDALTADELRTVVHEAKGMISSNYHQMLLRILGLERVTIEHAMTPRNEIYGIDISEDWPTIEQQILNTNHRYVPVYNESIDQVEGMLLVSRALSKLSQHKLDKQSLMTLLSEVYFIPEGTLLNQQLLTFQQKKIHIGLVVDEYGDIQGLVNINDILEEIGGEFPTDIEELNRSVRLQKDGSYLIDGSISVRDLRRMTDWELPTDGPKTLSGLIVEELEMIPFAGVCLRLAGYPMEVLEVTENNTIRTVRIWPGLHHH
ncbi:MAG TPA: HlyC/CorC family transporter, partial [Coxiellaceae bacterium]|nr:HlyC/CorC family transporter [Coxiellaceae bacterium]